MVNNLPLLGFLLITKDTGGKISVTAALAPHFVDVTDAERLLLRRPDLVPPCPALPAESSQGRPVGT